MGIVYWLLYHILKVALWTFYRDIRVVGAEHVPRRRPVIICGYVPAGTAGRLCARRHCR